MTAKANGINYDPKDLPGVKSYLSREDVLNLRSGQKRYSQSMEEPTLPTGYDWTKAQAQPKPGYRRVYAVNVTPEIAAEALQEPHSDEDLSLMAHYFTRGGAYKTNLRFSPDLFHTTDPEFAAKIQKLFGPKADLRYIDAPLGVIRRGMPENLPNQFQGLFINPSETILDRQSAGLLERGTRRPITVPQVKPLD
jgi:hypothetical protein